MLHRIGYIRSALKIRAPTVWFVGEAALFLALVAAPPVSAHTTAVTDTAVLDGGAGSKFAPSVALGADGLNVIAYVTGFGELKVAHCVNVQCSAATVSTLVRRIDFTTTTSIGVGRDGLPVIAFRDHDQRLVVAHCNSAACKSAKLTTVVDQSFPFVGSPRLTIGGDGYPVIVAGAGRRPLGQCSCLGTARTPSAGTPPPR